MSEARSVNPNNPPVMGTGDAEGVPSGDGREAGPAQRKWLIARVPPNTEKSSCKKLEKLQYEAFAVTQEEVGFWKNGERKKKKKIQRVIITQYIFVHVNAWEREKLLSFMFIKGYMLNRATSSDLHTYAVLTDEEVRRLKSLTRQGDYPVSFIPSGFKVGEEVNLHLGNSNYTANIIRVLDKNTTCIGVRVKELGCAYIEVPPNILSK